MVVSAVQLAKRAFLKVLLAFAAQYVVPVNVNRDSSSLLFLSARPFGTDPCRTLESSQGNFVTFIGSSGSNSETFAQ